MCVWSLAMRIFCVTNLKGGTGKTTTSVLLAHALADAGHRVMVVDADPQRSASRWAELAGWDADRLPVVDMPSKKLHQVIAGIVPPDVSVVVIDTPPLEEQVGIVLAAMRAATDVVATLAPTMMEFERLPNVWDALEDVEPTRTEPARVSVLLNRTVANASSTGAIRELISSSGRHVLGAEIPRLEGYAQAFGAPVTVTPHFAAVATELMAREAVGA